MKSRIFVVVFSLLLSLAFTVKVAEDSQKFYKESDQFHIFLKDFEAGVTFSLLEISNSFLGKKENIMLIEATINRSGISSHYRTIVEESQAAVMPYREIRKFFQQARVLREDQFIVDFQSQVIQIQLQEIGQFRLQESGNQGLPEFLRNIIIGGLIEELFREVRKQNSNIQQLETKIDQLEVKVDKQESQINQQQTVIDQQGLEILNQQNEIKELSNMINKQETKIDENVAQVQSLNYVKDVVAIADQFPKNVSVFVDYQTLISQGFKISNDKKKIEGSPLKEIEYISLTIFLQLSTLNKSSSCIKYNQLATQQTSSMISIQIKNQNSEIIETITIDIGGIGGGRYTLFVANLIFNGILNQNLPYPYAYNPYNNGQFCFYFNKEERYLYYSINDQADLFMITQLSQDMYKEGYQVFVSLNIKNNGDFQSYELI